MTNLTKKMNGMESSDITAMTGMIQGVVELAAKQLLKDDPKLRRVDAYTLAQTHVGMALHWLHTFKKEGEISYEKLAGMVAPGGGTAH